MLEYSLIQRHQPRFNVRYRDDKSYPFSGGDAGGRVAPCHGHPRQAQEGQSLLRALSGMRMPYERRSTCCSGPSLSAPVPTASSTDMPASESHAWISTSRSAAGLALVRLQQPSTSSSSTISSSSWQATPMRWWRGSKRRCWPRPSHKSSSLPLASETASSACARQSRSSRWWALARGLRHHRCGRRRARSRRPGLLCPEGPSHGPTWIHRRQGRRARSARARGPSSGTALLR